MGKEGGGRGGGRGGGLRERDGRIALVDESYKRWGFVTVAYATRYGGYPSLAAYIKQSRVWTMSGQLVR
jgi:hypothetical protein